MLVTNVENGFPGNMLNPIRKPVRERGSNVLDEALPKGQKG